MRRALFRPLSAGMLLIVASSGLSGEATSPRIVGWRGDGTGRYPEATPPTVWGRWPKGPLRDLRSQARKPQGDSTADSRPLEFNIIREWLVLGPFPTGEKGVEQEYVPNEAELRPDENEKVGDLAWKTALQQREGEDFGNVSIDWLRLDEDLAKKGQIVYAHAYLHSETDGKVVFVFDHQGPFKAWVNGKAVYANPKGSVSIWAINNISWAMSVYRPLPFEIAARRVEVDLTKGWNRVLFKMAGSFHLRLTVAPGTEYEEKNIVWAAKLPDRSNASPLVVGDRVFVCSEPDELICVSKSDGKILWRRSNSFFDATPEEERARNPVLEGQVPPLAEKLKSAETYAEKLALRKQITELLLTADKDKYEMKAEGHTISHLPLAGWSTPTPVSDGTNVFVWHTLGVAACYGLDGNRKWIQRVDLLLRDPKEKYGPYRYPCSPLLVGDKLILGIVYEGMVALNTRDGSHVWTQRAEKSCMVANLAARVAGTDAVFTSNGDAVRVADGKVLWNETYRENVGIACFEDGVLTLARYSMASPLVRDFRVVQGDSWTPKATQHEIRGIKSEATYGPPLQFDGLLYTVSSDAILHVIDLQAMSLVYRQKLDLKPMFNYNAAGLTSSPTLGGKHIYAMDNQGNAIVFEPGREFRQVAKNSIQTHVTRDFPLNPQETTTYANPVSEGKRLYIRGEQYLYCIGE